MRSNVLISRFVNTLDSMDQAGKRIPGLLLSHPGFGKTSTIRMFAEYKNYNCVELIPSQYAPDDVVGIQVYENGELVRKQPVWFKKVLTKAKEKRTILFIDEITTCNPYIQGPLLDLIFSRSIGEAKLPENVFIIAAGNYSSDLNGEFTMSNPLINRFLLLNLENSDFELDEILDEDFETRKTDQEIEDYLGLKEDEIKAYSYEAIKTWMKESGNIGFGTTTPNEVEELGILGFTSIRSINFVNKFIRAYTQKYSDDTWMRIAGDTLGTSLRKENKPLRLIFKMEEDKFCTKIESSELSLTEMLNKINSADEITLEMINDLKKVATATPASDITTQDLKAIGDIMRNNAKSSYANRIGDIVLLITNKYNEISNNNDY